MLFFSLLIPFLLTILTNASPVPDPEAEALADPEPMKYQPYPAAFTAVFVNGTRRRDVTPVDMKLLGSREYNIVAVAPLLGRSPEYNLEKRTDTTDGWCGEIAGTSCVAPWGMCCGGIDFYAGRCGSDQNYCAGGCQREWGACYFPKLLHAWDADAGDLIWNPETNNVFEAEVGDGMLYYGNGPEAGGAWPTSTAKQ